MSEAPERIWADVDGCWWYNPFYMASHEYVRADHIDELEAKLAKAVEALTVIDALDPEGLINGCSQSALIGLVLRMGEIARTTLAELSSVSCANTTGGKDE